jgi:hypothetical protein
MAMNTLSLEKWTAWAPGIESEDEWKQYFNDTKVPSKDYNLPKNNYIPKNIKRRCSSLIKLTLYGALQCVKNTFECDINGVFVSRYGDMNTTNKLLEDISHEEQLSPFDFSHSVHNTSAGLFSIITKNHSPTVSISGGISSFCYGFIETLKFLNRFPQNKVVLVISEESLPKPFCQKNIYPLFPYVFAFLFSLNIKNIAYNFSNLIEKSLNTSQNNDVFLFFNWLLSENSQLNLTFNDRSLLLNKLI